MLAIEIMILVFLIIYNLNTKFNIFQQKKIKLI